MSNQLLTTFRIAILVAATALFATTSSNAGVLYDQTLGAAGNGETSQRFGPANDTFSNEGADDFVVPAGGWTVRSIDVLGVITVNPIPPANRGVINNVDITFYADSSGQPGSTVIASFNDVRPTIQDSLGDFTVNLPCEVNLAAGTYWLSVVVDEDLATFGQWFWETTADLSYFGTSFAHWRNPGMAFGNGCTDWTVRTACLTSSDPNNVFALHDSLQGCISVFPYQEDFEVCEGQWQIMDLGGVVSPTWTRGIPSPPFGAPLNGSANAFWTNGGLTIPAGENSVVMSPCFDFSNLSNPEISIDIFADALNGGLNGAVLQASTDGGVTWQNVGSNTSSTNTTTGPSSNWFDITNLTPNGAGGQNVSHWSTNGGWLNATHLLTDPSGTTSLGGQSNVTLRIAFRSNLAVSGAGFAFDNIIIREGPDSDLAVTDVTSPVSGCALGSTETVSIDLFNNSTVAQSGFTVGYVILGPNADTVTETFAGTIPAGGTSPYTFTATFDASAIGTYNVTAFVQDTGSINNLNDTFTTSFDNNAIPPALTGVTDDTICGLDTICLTASGQPDSITIWYDGPSAMSNVVALGDTLKLINPSVTDTFWATSTTFASGASTVDTVISTTNGLHTEVLTINVPNNGGVGGARVTAIRMFGDYGSTIETADFAINGTVIGTGLRDAGGDCAPMGPVTPAWTPVDITALVQGQTTIDLEVTQNASVNNLCNFNGIANVATAFEVTIEWDVPLCQSTFFPAYAVVQTAPPISIANDTAICGTPGPVTFTASSGASYTYTWTGSANSGVVGSFVGNPLVTTPGFGSSQVFVEGLDGNGCRAQDTANISAASVSITNIVGIDSICPGDSTTISAILSTGGIPPVAVIEEDFQSFPGGQNTNVSVNGWTEAGSGFWSGDEGGTSSTATGPDVDHTFGTAAGRYIYLETSGGANTTNFFISPVFDISNLTSSSLSFWYHMFGATMGTLEVETSTDGGATWTNVFSISGQQQVSGLAPWTNVNIPLAANVNRIRFVGLGGTSFTSDMAIDDVVVSGSPLTLSWTPTSSLTSTNTATTIAFPGSSTTYQLIALDSTSGCADTNTFDVTIRIPPAAPTAADSTRCGTGTSLLTAVPNGSGILLWYDSAVGGSVIGFGPTISSPVVSSTTEFYVALQDFNGCIGARDTAILTVVAADSIALTITDTLVCGSGTITMTATQIGGAPYTYTYFWGETAGGGLNATTGTPVTADPTASATYTVTGIDLGGSGCQSVSSVDVSFGSTPVYAVTPASPDTICEGDTITLSAGGSPISVIFEDFETFPNGTNVTQNGWTESGPGNWQSDENGTGSSNTGPRFDHTLFGVNGGQYIYTEASGTAGTVNVFTSPVFDASSLINTELSFWYHMFGGNMGTLEAEVSTDGGTTWTQVFTLTGQQQTSDVQAWNNFSIPISNNVNRVRFIGTVGPGFTSDMAIDDFEVFGFPPYTGSWSPMAGLSDPNSLSTQAYPVVSTDYIITVTDTTSGCFSMDTVEIEVIPAPAKPTAYDSTRCGTGTLLLEAMGTVNDSLRWFDLSGAFIGSGSPLTSPITASTTQFVVAEFDQGCSSESDTMTATIIAADSISIIPSDTTVCGPNVPLTFNATQIGGSPYTYLYTWAIDTGAIVPAGSTAVGAAGADGAIVTVTGIDAGTGCAFISTATIGVVDLPVVTASVDRDSVCNGDTVNLSASVAPTPFNYTVTAIAVDTFTNTGTPLALGFNQNVPTPLGFNFEFYGNTYNVGFAGSNGVFGFNNVGLNNQNPPAIPNAGLPNDVIAGLWEYLRPDNSGSLPSVRYKTEGVAPNRVFVLTYSEVPWGFNTGSNTFQIQLYETSNIIEVHIVEVNKGGATHDEVIGIENSTGTIGAFVPGRNANFSNVNYSLEAYRFTPPTSYSYSWMPMAGVVSPDTLATAAVINGAGDVTTSYIFSAFDSTTGCTGFDTVDVYENPILSAPFTVPSTVCGAQAVNLTAISTTLPPDSFNWYILPADTLFAGTNGFGIATTPILTETTDYRVVEVIRGCEGISALDSVIVLIADTISLSVTDTFICDTAATVTITATQQASGSGYTYSWTWTGPDIVSGANSATVVVSPDATATYQVTGMQAGGLMCQEVAFANVAVGTPPATNAQPPVDTICEGDTVTIQAFNPPSPFSEDFSSWPAFSSAPGINGWTETGFWQSEETTTSSSATGPTIDHTSQVSASPSRYIYLEASSAGTGSSSFFTSPVFDVSGLVNTSFSFWYHMYGSTMGTMNVQLSNDGGATWTTVWTQTGQVQTSNAAPWLNVTIPVNNDINRIRFQGIDGASFNGDMAIDDVELTGIAPFTVSWSPAAGLDNPNTNSTQAYPTVSTEYVATVTDTTSGCFSLDTVDLTVIPTAAKPMAFDSTRCGFGTLELTAGTTGISDSLRWFDMAGNYLGNGSPLTSPVIADTTDFQVVEFSFGCEGVRDTMTANVIPADSIGLVATDTLVCGSGTIVNFTATQFGAATYNYYFTWTGQGLTDSTGANASAVVDVTETYTVTGTDTLNGTGCANTADIVVEAFANPAISTLDADTICQGDTTQLNVSGVGGIVQIVEILTVNVAGGVASTTVTVPNGGAINAATMDVRMRGDFGSPGFENADIRIDGVTVAAAIDPGQPDCSPFAPAATGVNVLPQMVGQTTIFLEFDITPGVNVCSPIAEAEITFNINAAQPYDVVWSPNFAIDDTNASFPNVWPNTTQDYFVTVTDSITGCFTNDTITVEVIPTPGLPIALDTSRCGIGTVPLVATAAAEDDSLRWFDMSGTYLGNGSPLTSSFLTATADFRVAEFDFGCEGPSDTMTATVIPADPITISATDTGLCGVGASTTFTATQGGALTYNYQYSWTGSGLDTMMGSVVTATPPATGSFTYIVSGSDAGSGCANSDTIDILVEPIPTATASASPDSVCSGDPLTLTGSVVPDPANYSVTSIGFDTLSGVGTNVVLADDNAVLVPLGFTFNFYGNNYTSVRIGSNGYLSFGTAGHTGFASRNSQDVPNATDPDDMIALCWEDLNPPAGGSVDYYTTGVAPNRIFVLNFRGVPFSNNTGEVNIQAQLHEASGNIEVHNVLVNTAGFQSSVQGIENSTGTLGVAVPGRNDTDWDVFTPDAWLFSPPAPVSFLWTGGPVSSPTSQVTTANPVTTTDYIFNVITTSGCTASDTVTTTVKPLPFNLTPNNLQTTATDFRWNSGNPGSVNTVYWGVVGFIPGGAGQLGQVSGNSNAGVNTTGTATVTSVAVINNSVTGSTATQLFNVPAGGNITSATLNIRLAGDFGSPAFNENADILIDGNLVAGAIDPGTPDCSPLAPAGPANIDVTALLQGNATVNLGFFINTGVNICTPFGQAEFTFTIDTVVSGPTTATGLLPNTTYQFYVEEDCGITGPINFTTPIGCFWLGNNSNWNDPVNWSAACGGVPRGCGAPDITVGPTSNDPIVTVDDSLNNIEILAGAAVTIDPTINLYVCGDWSNLGTFSHGDGLVVMQGDTNQSIIGSSDFGFLVIDNQSGGDVSILPGASVGINNGLIMTNADLNVPSSASLTILSTATGTGYVDDFTSGSAGSIIGDITMQRLVRNTGAGRAFYYISSAVAGTRVSDWSDDFSTDGQLYGVNVGPTNLDGRQVIPTAACLVDSLDPYSPYGGLFQYIEAAVTGCTLEGWHVESQGAINTGEGYAGIIPDGVVVDVTGPANTGTYLVPITLSGGNTATPGFNLAGNPYPSAIDWATVVAENAAMIQGSAYLWQSTGFYSGVTLPLNVMISGEIGSSQGFEVEALMSGNLTFNQTQRTTGDPAFVRTVPLWEQRLDLVVEGNGFADVTRIVFSSVSTDGFDGWYDSYKRDGNSFQPSIWTKLNTDNMSINSFGDFDGSEVVDVDMTPGQNGTYTIKGEYLETFDPTTLVFLEDKQAGVVHCLTFNPEYTFTGNVNDASDRFLVYFTPPANITAMDASCSGNDGAITVDLGVFSLGGSTFQWDNYQVLDDNNAIVSSGSNANGVINVNGLNTGNYTLVLDYQGNTLTQTIVVDGDQAVVADFTVPNTTLYAGDPIVFTNTTTGANDHNWEFGDGTILTGVLSPTYTYTVPGTYSVKLVSTNDDGCQDITTNIVEIAGKTTGVGVLDEDLLNVYSANNVIYIDVIDVTEPVTEVSVYDMTGKLVVSEEFDGVQVHTIPMDEASGFYIVNATNGDITVSRKILIE